MDNAVPSALLCFTQARDFLLDGCRLDKLKFLESFLAGDIAQHYHQATVVLESFMSKSAVESDCDRKGLISETS